MAWLDRDTPFLAMAGAGLSIPAPTCAPGVEKVLRTTIDVLTTAALPVTGPDNPADFAFESRLLPESCYGAIAAAAGRADHLRLWEAYGWIGADPGVPQPNAGHHLLVEQAARTGVPVLTTNFDLFLEQAAALQGLDAQVCLPRRDGTFAGEPVRSDAAAVWKLHGTALDPRTLRSQPPDLVRSSYNALRTALPSGLNRFLIVGYSGRDFDVYPWLRALVARADVLWIDLKFPPDHRARAVPDCLTCEASFEEVARSYLAAHRADSPAGRAAAVAAMVDPLVSDRGREQFAERVEGAVREHVGAVVAGEPHLARLALTVMINTVADFPQAIRLARTGADLRSGDPRLLLALEFALDSSDRLRSADLVARAARRRALLSGRVLLAGRAELALSYCRLRRHKSTFTEPEVRSAYRNPRRSTLAFARILLDAAVLAPLYVYASVMAARDTEDFGRYDALGFTADYIENLIRIAAVVRRVLERMPAAGLNRILDKEAWRFLGVLARRAGYMRGVLNVAKYRARRERNFEALFGSEVVGDLVAGALAERDAALHCLSLADAPGVQDAVRGELLDEALKHLLSALDGARRCGSPSLVIKILLIMRTRGWVGPMGPEKLDGLMRALQGEADRAAVPILRALLGTAASAPAA